jgi:hypothetical protein
MTFSRSQTQHKHKKKILMQTPTHLHHGPTHTTNSPTTHPQLQIESGPINMKIITNNNNFRNVKGGRAKCKHEFHKNV